jgi:hypothetical protein
LPFSFTAQVALVRKHSISDTFVITEFALTWLDPGFNPGCLSGKPATNRLSHGVASSCPSCSSAGIILVCCYAKLCPTYYFLPKSLIILHKQAQCYHIRFKQWLHSLLIINEVKELVRYCKECVQCSNQMDIVSLPLGEWQNTIHWAPCTHMKQWVKLQIHIL